MLDLMIRIVAQNNQYEYFCECIFGLNLIDHLNLTELRIKLAEIKKAIKISLCLRNIFSISSFFIDNIFFGYAKVHTLDDEYYQ